MMRISDNMIIHLLEGESYGRNRHYSSSVRGHLKPLNYHTCSAHLMWTGLLGDVGARVGEGDNTCNLCHIQSPNGENQGEK